ncbi:MAG: lasso RiPP family leader peptide-containing protein [Deltaproteobacteria bacterium]
MRGSEEKGAHLEKSDYEKPKLEKKGDLKEITAGINSQQLPE